MTRGCTHDSNVPGWLLARIGDPASGDAIVTAMGRAADFQFQNKMVNALIAVRGRAAAKPLIEQLAEGKGKDVQLMALYGLRYLYVPEAADAAIRLLKNPKGPYRSQACLLLPSYGDAKTVGPLCDAVRGEETPGVRRYAAYALGRIGDPAAIDALIELLNAIDLPAAPKLNLVAPDKNPEQTAELGRTNTRLQALGAIGARPPKRSSTLSTTRTAAKQLPASD
jgi:HEAT repeat protein